MPKTTLLLTRRDVASVLDMDECIEGVADAFRRHAEGKTVPPGILGMPAPGGGFHIKAAALELDGRGYFAAKVNGNFPGNAERFGLPTIQGVIALCDWENGFPLAVMDSIEITIVRTAAATAVAARHLARDDAASVTICGCGNQGRSQLRALSRVRPVRTVFAIDASEERAVQYAAEMRGELGIDVQTGVGLEAALARSDVCVTCTPARRAFLRRAHVRPGTFVAAVGADSPDKQELEPELLAGATVVTDILEQCAEIGDLHHALAAGVMRGEQVHAELGEVVAGLKRGRATREEITIFDSTGTALQDVAAAAVVYRKALATGRGTAIELGRG